jgi:hypothetical protein
MSVCDDNYKLNELLKAQSNTSSNTVQNSKKDNITFLFMTI